MDHKTELLNKRKPIEDAIRSLNQTLTLIDLAGEAVGRGAGGREVSLAKTNAQQARHWLIDALTELTEDHLTSTKSP